FRFSSHWCLRMIMPVFAPSAKSAVRCRIGAAGGSGPCESPGVRLHDLDDLSQLERPRYDGDTRLPKPVEAIRIIRVLSDDDEPLLHSSFHVTQVVVQHLAVDARHPSGGEDDVDILHFRW